MEKSYSSEIVHLKNKKYFFDLMEQQILKLTKTYPFIAINIIGYSVQNRPLYCLTIGDGAKKIHVNGSHHANEWITSIVIMKSIEWLCKYSKSKLSIESAPIAELFKKVSYDFVPMVNPDGVELCVNTDRSAKDFELYVEMNEGSTDFSRWKSNIHGVDLNRNYNAGFENYQLISEKKHPSYGYYQGIMPECEPESQALATLTRIRQYDMVFAYHTQGEVIYWNYSDCIVDNAFEYAKIFSEASGYMLDSPEETAASGGYKDWFIDYFHKPGFTIECGHGENPIDPSQTDTIVSKTLPILLLASKDIGKEELS